MMFASLPWYLMVGDTVWALYHEELYRDPDPEGAATWVGMAREHGWNAEQIRAAIRQSPEWHALHP